MRFIKNAVPQKKLRAVALTIWWSTWAALHFKILVNFGIDYKHAIADSIISNLLLAGFCFLIINNMRYYLPGKERYWYVLVVSFALSGVWLAITRLLLWLLFRHDHNPVYMHSLSKSSSMRFAIGFLLTGCVTMLSLLWYTQKEQKALNSMKQEAENLLKEAELFKLRQQLQPHFLFNSLNSISSLAGSDPEKARHMIQQLSDFLRGTLKKEEKQMIALQEEIQFLQLYLDIEKVRFGNRLHTSIHISDEAGRQMIPALILQPVVENAIKFGLYDTTEDVTITIRAFTEEQTIKVEVSNPYDAETAAFGKGTGFGLSSVQRRLFLLYERNDLLAIDAHNTIFTTSLTIPV